jgi:hypothetical protein
MGTRQNGQFPFVVEGAKGKDVKHTIVFIPAANGEIRHSGSVDEEKAKRLFRGLLYARETLIRWSELLGTVMEL